MQDINSIPTIEEFSIANSSTDVNNSDICEELVHHIFRCDASGSYPHTILFSVDSKVLQDSVDNLTEYVKSNREKVSELFTAVAKQFNISSSEDVTNLPEEMLVDYFKSKVSSIVAARPINQNEIQSKVYILSAVEASMTLRNNLISKVIEKVDLGKILSEYGVNTDYRPSVEVLEIAVLSALISNGLKSGGSLWTPGKPF